MSGGRSIRLFFASGVVTGIRHVELVNWTGQAIVCPRSRMDELAAEWMDEVDRPGVYLLVGGEDAGAREVYIGEAEVVLKRVRQHVGSKEFWQEAILFTSKDRNLTKAHVRYLEHRLVQKAKQTGRYKVTNSNEPNETSLPRADKAAMEEFLEAMALLLGALGLKLLVPIAVPASTPQEAAERFRFSMKEVEAFGIPTDEGFVVLEGSTGLARTRDSMPPGNIVLKGELVEQGKLEVDGTLVRFAEDVLFATPSQAATIVSGIAMNGRLCWKRVSDGRTLKELDEAREAAAAVLDDA